MSFTGIECLRRVVGSAERGPYGPATARGAGATAAPS